MKIFHLNGPEPLYTNSFLLITDAGHGVIIDPAAEAQQYDRYLKQENAKLTHILCTHGHFDHVGAAEELKAEWGAKLYCEAADIWGTGTYPLKAADCGYAEGETICVDELKFTVWHTPGHTEGSVCILCGEYFFTGDTLFCGDTGRTDMPGGSHEKMVESCKKLKSLALPMMTKVLPGHEDFSTYGREMGGNAFIREFCE
jgi:hydroxyacylglutathione hydrolase